MLRLTPIRVMLSWMPLNLARLLMIDLSGSRLTPDEREFLSQRQPGGVCLFARNVVDRFQLADYIEELRSLAGPELIVTVDQEGGGVVRVTDLPYPPSAMALGAADDVELTRAVAEATGHGLASVGIDVDLAPVADVNSNPANPVIADRSFGADPELVSRHVVAFVQGLQSAGVGATVKHFPGHGDAAVDSHLALPTLDLSLEELERREWPPFVAAFEAGVAAVMTAHIVMRRIDPEFPGTLSRTVITGLLRERLGFDGVVFTDALEMKAIAERWGGPEAAVLALAAGVDMPAQVASLKVQEETVVAIEQAVAAGRLDERALAVSAGRLSRLRRLDRPRPDPAGAWREGDAELLDEAARRALVALGESAGLDVSGAPRRPGAPAGLPRVEPGGRVVLVAAQATRQNAATQAAVSPASGLASALRERGVEVVEVPYQPDEAASVLAQASSVAETADLLVFASTARTVIKDSEVELARGLAEGLRGGADFDGAGGAESAETASWHGHRAAFVHVALWNPYLVRVVPGPALVTFSWRDRSLKAAAAALLGEIPASATAPAKLRD